jgi:hypothetical protein
MAVLNEGKTWLAKSDFSETVPAMRKDDGSFRVLVDDVEDATVVANSTDNATGSGWTAVKAIFDA